MADEQMPSIDTQVAAIQQIGVHVPLESAQAAQVKRGLKFSRTWTCTTEVKDEAHPDGVRPCGATLTVSSKQDHADGPSNFVAHKSGKAKGHSKLDQSELTWEGLREEREWARDGDQIQCPACQTGMTLADYREMRRRERIHAQIADLQAQLTQPAT